MLDSCRVDTRAAPWRYTRVVGRLPVVRAQQVVGALRRDGWYERNQVGSRLHLMHAMKPGIVTVPMHQGETLAPGTLRNILRQAGLTADEFRRLL